MRLKGSCQCGAVGFSLRSAHPVPYQRCYCAVCRKQQGSGGYAVNLSGDAASLKVKGQVAIHHAKVRNPGRRMHVSGAERAFCAGCATALWLFSSDYPKLIHPFASAIDTDLPVPPQTTHIMLAFKPGWVRPDIRKGDMTFAGYPDESIADWHRRHGLEDLT